MYSAIAFSFPTLVDRFDREVIRMLEAVEQTTVRPEPAERELAGFLHFQSPAARLGCLLY
jgi:hypothetical protein